MSILLNQGILSQPSGFRTTIADMSITTQGTNGWYAGYFTTYGNGVSTNSTTSSFSTTGMVYAPNPGASPGSWSGSLSGSAQFGTPFAGPGFFYPKSQSGTFSRNPAVVKWVSTRAGTALLTFAGYSTPTVYLKSIAIYVNNTKVAGYSPETLSTASVSTTVTLAIGDAVYFEVNPASSTSYSDSFIPTNLSIQFQ